MANEGGLNTSILQKMSIYPGSILADSTLSTTIASDNQYTQPYESLYESHFLATSPERLLRKASLLSFSPNAYSPYSCSGCTTLLKSIAGETHGFYVQENAEINYQGIPWKTMHKDFRGEVVYNAETDVHFPNLTVGQTLSFAARAQTPRARLPGVTREMWADHMLHARFGNDFVRGVSGGERKRVSIAEVALSGSPLQCWDNSTRGLDSATALEFVKTVRLSTKYQGATAVVAIYQASQDIYDIFDKVVVLYEGRQIYFGTTTDAKKFFIDMGFDCPPQEARPGFESRVPRTPDEFAKAWTESDDRKRLLQQIDAFERQYPVGGEQLAKFRDSRKRDQAKGMRTRSPYTISMPMQVRLCINRGFQRLQGDMTLFFTALFGNFIMALIIGSIFYNLDKTSSSFYSRGALLFFAVLMNAFSSVLEIMTLYELRPIVEKHSRMAFYHPSSEAISSMICDLPAKILNAVGFNLVLYFMTNLRRTPSAFFTFLLFSFFCTLSMSMIFRTIGAMSRTISQAMAPAAKACPQHALAQELVVVPSLIDRYFFSGSAALLAVLRRRGWQ
ncbi:hypothetical protein BDZ89DRAFT_1050014 [Hymenopellis radicata]|nr:hypothetical protein BDZ89DRAFT_1050014 [Hymenopellis radicata]